MKTGREQKLKTLCERMMPMSEIFLVVHHAITMKNNNFERHEGVCIKRQVGVLEGGSLKILGLPLLRAA